MLFYLVASITGAAAVRNPQMSRKEENSTEDHVVALTLWLLDSCA